jgi:succinate dehydrogenase / fumarate reductase membrane anchor subunit
LVKRDVTGAHYGALAWLAQRATAVVLVAYTLLCLGLMLGVREVDFDIWCELFSHQWMKLATLLALASACFHAWVGLRNIFMDYVKPVGVRLTLYVVVICWLVACAGWSMQILWSV